MISKIWCLRHCEMDPEELCEREACDECGRATGLVLRQKCPKKQEAMWERAGGENECLSSSAFVREGGAQKIGVGLQKSSVDEVAARRGSGGRTRESTIREPRRRLMTRGEQPVLIERVLAPSTE